LPPVAFFCFSFCADPGPCARRECTMKVELSERVQDSCAVRRYAETR
jgi:hypothetical protein